MTDKSHQSLQLVLGQGYRAGRVLVDLEPFIEFDLDMNFRLETLVEQWADETTAQTRQWPETPVHRGLR